LLHFGLELLLLAALKQGVNTLLTRPKPAQILGIGQNSVNHGEQVRKMIKYAHEYFADSDQLNDCIERALLTVRTEAAAQMMDEIVRARYDHGMDMLMSERQYQFLTTRSRSAQANAVLEYRKACEKLAEFCQKLGYGDATEQQYQTQGQLIKAMQRNISRRYQKMLKAFQQEASQNELS
jgi:cob(I)alamin adenosyltransferase